MVLPPEEPRTAVHLPATRAPALQTKTGRPSWDGPSVRIPTATEGYFFAVFFVAFLVFRAAFPGALGFALRAPIVLATFRS